MEEKPEDPGVLNPAHKLAKKLQENRKSLHIARIPDKTRESFVALAESEFCGDYGMTLKWLMDDILSADTRMIFTRLEEIETKLRAIETGILLRGEEKEQKHHIKMCDGSKKEVKKNG